MRDLPHSPPSVVVGLDGSRSALDAALWAVDEAVSRDIPLRLVYAVDPDDSAGSDPQDAARDLAAAEIAVRYAFTAVESTEKPVKIEVEICRPGPTRALIDASRSAAMLCWETWASDTRHRAGSVPRPRKSRPPPIARWPSSAAMTRARANTTGWLPRLDGSPVGNRILQRGLR